VSVLVFVGCGPHAESMRQVLGDGLYGGMIGEPEAVATHLRSFSDMGVDRIQVSQWLPGSMTAVAPYLNA
jgi:hypothetical protein